ncbi:MAG: phage tail protein [Bacteroidia bacterium]|nr:phage tail protein [Bacteroidia bacterium]
MYDNDYFPPASFYFGVEIDGMGSGTVDSMFQEVSGIEVESDVEEINEGGLNDHTHRVPGRIKYKNLVLKRGLAPESSKLAAWCHKRFDDSGQLSSPVELKKITVTLFDEKENPVTTWSFDKAYPVKWSVSNFNAQENALAIETVEFAYRTFSKS